MKVCLFDIDGTLLSSGGAGKAAMLAALREEFGIGEPAGQVSFAGRTDRSIIHDFFQAHAIDDTDEHWQRFVDAYLARLPQAMADGRGRVLPGIEPLLQTLSEHAHAVGLLTGNMQAGARTKLAHYGLHRHFSFGAFGDVHPTRDDVAREALQIVGRLYFSHLSLQDVPCRDIWVIGDTPLDVQCARAIGARAVAVATGSHSFDELGACDPDLLFADFSSAEAFLSELV